MNHYIVSARKYRPSTFRSVVGQDALTTTLKNAITSNKLAHAYLFCGPRGVGKTTCARIFAKTINCLNLTADNEPCNCCESCVAFNEQRSYNIRELDAASNNGVDDIRSLVEQVRIPPQIGKYSVYIIDEVHMLSAAAFNSFLKTLEEPPAHAIFILATTEKHKIIPTILSRCQVYDFSRISISDIVNQLQYIAGEEGVTAEAEALNIIAQKADGGMRDALSIFDQCVSYSGGVVTYKAVIENLHVLDYEYYFRLTDAVLNGNVVASLLILNDILNSGFEGQYVSSGITSHLRDLLVCKDPISVQLFPVGASIKERYIEMAGRCSNIFLYKAIEIANTCDLDYRLSRNKRLLLELSLIKLCQLSETSEGSDSPKKTEIKSIVVTKKENNTKPVKENSDTVTKPLSNNPKQQLPIDQPSTTKPNIVSEPKVNKMDASESPKKVTSNLQAMSLSGMGLSLSNKEIKKEVTEEQKEPAPQEPVKADIPFTESDLINAWNDYEKELTDEVILKKSMKNYQPKLIKPNLFKVEVNSEMNKEYIEASTTSIISFLREKLGNSDLKLTIQVTEVKIKDKPKTSREIFDDFTQANPAVQKLSDEFNLELTR